MSPDIVRPMMGKSILRELASKVSHYFLEFLESDFKRQRAPRRRIRISTETGLLAGMSLRRYPKLTAEIRALLEKPARDGMELRIPRGKFQSPLSPTLKNLIAQHVAEIPDEAFGRVRNMTLEHAEATRGTAVEHPETWIEGVCEYFDEATSKEIVHPLLALLDGPIRQQAYAPVESAFELETDLISLVTKPAIEVLPEALNTFLVKADIGAARRALDERLQAADAKKHMGGFFEAFGTADAYAELRDLTMYLSTGENLQFYLYCCTISLGKSSFPLFYIPGAVTEPEDRAEYVIQFEPHLYVNKAAVDFIRQERQSPHRAVGDSPVHERIIYLGEDDNAKDIIAAATPGLCAAFDLPADFDFNDPKPQKVRTTEVALDNAFLFAAFDRSDEATLNDYEDLLVKLRTGSEDVTALFEDMVRGVILEEPASVRQDVDAAIDRLSLPGRLVIDSPIPLNEEQNRIRHALQDPRCRFVVVEGPPGTGKSHTISALAFDTILQGKTTLILSDKIEALDVVEAKLNDTMSRVRGDHDFQNPILRLGKQGANFRKLVSGPSLALIQAHHKSQKAHAPELDKELQGLKSSLSQNINQTATSLSSLRLSRIYALLTEERRLAAKYGATLITILQEIVQHRGNAEAVFSALNAIQPNDLAEITTLQLGTYSELATLEKDLCLAETAALEANASPRAAMALFKPLTVEKAKQCLDIYWRFKVLRRPIIGYLFRAAGVQALERELYETGSLVAPADLRKQKVEIYTALVFLLRLGEKPVNPRLKATDLPALQTWILRDYKSQGLGRVRQLLLCWLKLCENVPALNTFKNATFSSVLEQIRESAVYLVALVGITEVFSDLPDLNYLGDKSKIELLCTAKMTGIVDERFLDFTDQQRAKMRALAGVISAREKFPPDHFEALRNAFPVILAGIREFAEYMPLSHGLFDLLIIDEGSQVSVAQALTAVLRAKKIVVFGDSKQFSNVKSAYASNERNNAFRSDLKQYFKQNVARDAARLKRLSVFDVKVSILEFFQLCANFNIMLRKHFRGPQELISFCSEEFYGGGLQAIKVRTLPMEDTIRFNTIAPKEGVELLRNVNQAEAAFIIEKLEAILDDDEPPTVGIITPFREQQSYLSRELMRHPRWKDMERDLRLKIMTFDSCQGEEREVIFYSMVATRERDVLNYIFPVSLNDAENTIEEKLKLQRLNVGFSRSQETIWFVLSKPIDEYHGSIGVAIRHFHKVLMERSHGDAADTDPKSPMERKVLGWLNATSYIQTHRDHVDIQPQFPIGEYLRQLDPQYRHPLYKTDFLVTIAKNDQVVRVIIEYDGFEAHFSHEGRVDPNNMEAYMSDKDLERQLIIENYGYQFLRINRFNLGRDPVATLSKRLKEKVDTAVTKTFSPTTERVLESAEGLVNGDSKLCTSCGCIKPIKEFYDKSLRNGEGGHGRKCKACKTSQAKPGRRWRRRRW